MLRTSGSNDAIIFVENKKDSLLYGVRARGMPAALVPNSVALLPFINRQGRDVKH